MDEYPRHVTQSIRKRHRGDGSDDAVIGLSDQGARSNRVPSFSEWKFVLLRLDSRYQMVVAGQERAKLSSHDCSRREVEKSEF